MNHVCNQIYNYLKDNNLNIPKHFIPINNKYHNFNKLIEVSPDFKYYESCMESYPCQHGIKINGNNETWYGTTIYKYCVDNNLRIPQHFIEYKNF